MKISNIPRVPALLRVPTWRPHTLRRSTSRNAMASLALAALSVATLAAPTRGEFAPIADFPAGIACSFPLLIESDGTGHRVMKEFYDRTGNVVRYIDNGTGPDLRLTNTATGANMTLQGNGANVVTRPQPDGSVLVRTTGHNILIMYPTDAPPGPSTTLYVGQFVYTVNSGGVFTLQSSSGRQVNICAELGA
jgi:hypothetical protein